MKRKFMLQVVAWLLTVAMLLPSAGAALTTAYAAGEKAAYTGSVTYAASGEWAEKEITMKDLIGNVNPDDVAYISFTSDAKFNVGYNPADHSAWKWANYSTKHDVSDIALDGWFAFKFALNANDGKSYTIKWSVYTGDAKTPAQEQEEQDKNANVVHSGSATFSDSTWWTAYELKDRSALIGDVNPEDIAYVKFTCDTGFLLGYNNGGGYYQLESDSPVTTYVAKDINWDITAYYLQLILSKGDGKNYTIKWDVVSKVAATPTPTPTPTATPTPTPVPKYTDVGETLTVTKDMVKNGVVTIKNAQYNEIIVPAGLGITKINFNVIDVEKLVFEGGDSYTVNLRNALVEETEIAASKVEAMTYEELVKELEKAREAEDASDAVTAVANAFIASLQAKSKAAEAQLKLNAYDSVLDSVNVKANARIDVTEASVKDLAVSTKDASQRMEVRVTGFNGDAKVDLDKGGRTYNAPLSLTFRESAVDKLDVTGDEIFHVEGSKSTVDTMTLSGVNSVSSNLDAANLVVDEKNENANVRVYSDVANLIVEGEKNDVVLPASASIENAIVAGDNIRVYGLGELGNAEVTGTGANVATIGTAVEGENNTTMPQAMIEMLPTATPAPEKPVETPSAEAVKVTLDSDYSGDWANSTVIPASAFEGLNGDVKVTLGIEILEGFSWRCFTMYEGSNKLYQPEKKFMTTSETTDTTGKMTLDKNSTSLTFTLNADGIELIKSNGKLGIQYAGIQISKATFTDANNKVVEKTFSGPYSDWSTLEIAYTADVTGLIAPVTVKLDYTTTGGNNTSAYPHANWNPFMAVGVDYYVSPEKEENYNIPYCLKPDGTINVSDTSLKEVSFVLSADAVASIIANGTGIHGQIYAMYLTEATLTETGSTTVKPSTPVVPEKKPYTAVISGENAWSKTSISKADLLGEYKYEEVESITFTSEHTFQVGYNYSVTKNWTQHDDVAEPITIPITDITWDDKAYFVQVARYAESGKEYEVTWTVNEKSKDAHEHSYESKVTTEATCEEPGVKTFTCECGDTYTEAIEATGHSWDAEYTVDKAATCTEEGSKSIHCSACEATKNTTVIEKTEHNYKDGVCDCGDREESDVPVITPGGGNTGTSTPGAITPGTGSGEEGGEAHTHSYKSKVTTAATCKEKGVMTYTCECGDSYTEEIAVDATAHNWNADYTVDEAATCTEAGSKSIHCSLCDATKDSTVIEATGHSFVDNVCACGNMRTILFMDTGYVGKYGVSKEIPATVFAQYSGDVTVTMTYELTGDDANPWFKFLNSSWTNIPTSLEADSEGIIKVDSSANQLTFIVEKANLPTTSAFFQICGLYVTNVTFSGVGTVDADAAFVGGTYAIAHKIHDAQLETFRGKDIKIAFTYRKAEGCSAYNAALSAKYDDLTGYYTANLEEGIIYRTLTASQVNSILDSDVSDMFLGIKVNGLIVESVIITEDDYVEYLFDNGAANVSFWTNQVTWLTEAADTDIITLKYSGDEGKGGWGIGKWQANVDGVDVAGPNLSFGADSTQETTVTYTAGELKTAFGITETSTVANIQVVVYNTAKIILLKIEPAAN